VNKTLSDSHSRPQAESVLRSASPTENSFALADCSTNAGQADGADGKATPSDSTARRILTRADIEALLSRADDDLTQQLARSAGAALGTDTAAASLTRLWMPTERFTGLGVSASDAVKALHAMTRVDLLDVSGVSAGLGQQATASGMLGGLFDSGMLTELEAFSRNVVQPFSASLASIALPKSLDFSGLRSFTERMERFWTSWNSGPIFNLDPGKLDLFVLVARAGDPNSSPTDRLPYAEQLLHHIPYALMNPRVRRNVRWRAIAEGKSVAQILRDEALVAIYFVAAEAHQECMIYVRPDWDSPQANKRVSGVPWNDLSASQYFDWFKARVRRYMDQSLLDLPSFKSETSKTGEKEWVFSSFEGGVERIPSEEPDPLDALIAAEEHFEACRKLQSLLTASTPQQRVLLDLLEQGHSSPEAAALMNLSPSTIRVMMKHIRDRKQLA
jgi:hypothetical protein